MGSIVAELAEKLTSATNSFDIDEQTLYVNTAADTVGIGTNSPDGKLSVHQSGTGDIFNLYDGTTNILTVVDGGALTHNGTFTIGVDDTGYDVKFFGATATNGYMLWDQSEDSLVLGSSSKLGIGITAPSEKLEVDGNIKIADGGTIGSATTAGAITIASDGVVTLVDDLVIKDGGTIGSATTAAAITIAANGALTLSTAPAGFNYVATVAAAQTGSTDGIVISGSGTAAAGVTVAHADTSSQATVNNSGNSFIQDITLDTYGHIIGISSATATDTTYSVASGTALGLVQIGYTENGKNYPVELSSNKMYVNVPWTDTDTTYSVATTSSNGLMSSSDKSKSDNMGLVYLTSITFSGNQSDSFDLNSYTSYTNFYVTMHNVRVGSAGGSVLVRSGTTSNNQSQQKGAVRTLYASLSGPVSFDDNVYSTTGLFMLKYTSSTSDEGLSGSFTLFAPRDSSINTTASGVFSADYGGNLVTHQGGGVRIDSANDRYLSFMGYTSTFSSSTMLGGNARLYGMK